MVFCGIWMEVGILFFVFILENKKSSEKIVSYKAKSTIVRVRIVNPECDYGKTLKCKWSNAPVALQIAILDTVHCSTLIKLGDKDKCNI